VPDEDLPDDPTLKRHEGIFASNGNYWIALLFAGNGFQKPFRHSGVFDGLNDVITPGGIRLSGICLILSQKQARQANCQQQKKIPPPNGHGIPFLDRNVAKKINPVRSTKTDFVNKSYLGLEMTLLYYLRLAK
jgi:hypothetical protein